MGVIDPIVAKPTRPTSEVRGDATGVTDENIDFNEFEARSTLLLLSPVTILREDRGTRATVLEAAVVRGRGVRNGPHEMVREDREGIASKVLILNRKLEGVAKGIEGKCSLTPISFASLKSQLAVDVDEVSSSVDTPSIAPVSFFNFVTYTTSVRVRMVFPVDVDVMTHTGA